MIANTVPLRPAGRLVLQVARHRPDYYTARLLGWSRNPIVGQGATASSAVADWRTQAECDAPCEIEQIDC